MSPAAYGTSALPRPEDADVSACRPALPRSHLAAPATASALAAAPAQTPALAPPCAWITVWSAARTSWSGGSPAPSTP